MSVRRRRDFAWVVFGGSTAVVATSARCWWLRVDTPWWMPYLVWMGLIALGVVVARRWHGDAD